MDSRRSVNGRGPHEPLTFVDSSALLRRMFQEGDLTLIEAALAGPCAISTLTTIEVPVSIHARHHRGVLTPSNRDGLLAAAEDLLSTLSHVTLGVGVQREAVRIAERFLIRTLDALQIASATETRRRRPRRSVRFCTADHRQADAARALLGAGAVDLLPPYFSGE